MTRSPSRFQSLDGVRGLAAISVVFYHYVCRYADLYGGGYAVGEIFYFGKYGVNLFFILSGFVIYWSASRAHNLKGFLVSRVSRLYPAYLFSVMFTAAILALWPLSGRQVAWPQVFFNLTMFQEFFGVPHVDGVYWTLSVELCFYFIVSMLLVFGRLRWFGPLFGIVLFVSELHFFGYLKVPGIVAKLLLFSYLPYFLFGMSVYRVWVGENRFLFCLLCCLCVLAAAFRDPYPVAVIVCFIFFLFAIFVDFRWLRSRPLVFLGGVSYPLYLLHQNFGYVVIAEMTRLGVGRAWSISCAFVLSLSLALFVYKRVESPGRLFFNRLLS
jgi:peptidoglycan/LPS O-acetylase OafA/YrhL